MGSREGRGKPLSMEAERQIKDRVLGKDLFKIVPAWSKLLHVNPLRSRGWQVLRSLGEYFLRGKGREVQLQQQQQ